MGYIIVLANAGSQDSTYKQLCVKQVFFGRFFRGFARVRREHKPLKTLTREGSLDLFD